MTQFHCYFKQQLTVCWGHKTAVTEEFRQPASSEALHRLEEGLFLPDGEAETLAQAGRLLGFDHFCLVHANLSQLRTVAAEHSQAVFADYEAGGWLAGDYRARAMSAAPSGRLYVDNIDIPEGQRRGSAIYHDFLVPKGIAGFAGWRLEVADETWIYSLARAERAGDVSPHEAAQLAAFMPLANRTLQLAHRMRQARIDSAADFASGLGQALILIDHHGRAARVNGHAEAMFTDTFGVRDGRLWSARPQTQRHLDGLAHAARDRRGPGRLDNFVIDRGRLNGSVLARPSGVRGAGLDVLPGARILLTLVDPSRRLRPAVEDLRRLFGLTAAEAGVAALLAEGKDAEQVARQRGVAIGTIRAQIRQIFEKVGVNRIGELVALVLSVPQQTDAEPKRRDGVAD